MKITAYDVNGIPRCYGQHNNVDVAETLAKEAAIDYLKDRPDTGPLSRWIFMNDEKGWVNGRMN